MIKTVLLGALWNDEFKETGGDWSAQQQLRRRVLKVGQVFWSKRVKGSFVRKEWLLMRLTNPRHWGGINSPGQGIISPWRMGGKAAPLCSGFIPDALGEHFQSSSRTPSRFTLKKKSNGESTILYFVWRKNWRKAFPMSKIKRCTKTWRKDGHSNHSTLPQTSAFLAENWRQECPVRASASTHWQNESAFLMKGTITKNSFTSRDKSPATTQVSLCILSPKTYLLFFPLFNRKRKNNLHIQGNSRKWANATGMSSPVF